MVGVIVNNVVVIVFVVGGVGGVCRRRLIR